MSSFSCFAATARRQQVPEMLIARDDSESARESKIVENFHPLVLCPASAENW